MAKKDTTPAAVSKGKKTPAEQIATYTKVMEARNDMTPEQKKAAIAKYTASVQAARGATA